MIKNTKDPKVHTELNTSNFLISEHYVLKILIISYKIYFIWGKIKVKWD